MSKRTPVRVTIEELLVAALWLEAVKGDDAMVCKLVAAWIDQEIARRRMLEQHKNAEKVT